LTPLSIHLGANIYKSFDNRWSLHRTPGMLHLGFSINGKQIGYAYIRKNGCSAFKKLLGFHPSTDVSKISELYPFVSKRKYDAIIFVWRDPIERLISLYKSKILENRGATDIINRYQLSMGTYPSSFEEFVKFAVRWVDPHCIPQYTHLKRLRYTHAIPLQHLHQAMSHLIGKEHSGAFANPTNASSTIDLDIPAVTRRLIYRNYKVDYRMIRKLIKTP